MSSAVDFAPSVCSDPLPVTCDATYHKVAVRLVGLFFGGLIPLAAFPKRAVSR